MRLSSRLRKLEAAFPTCDGRVRRLVDPDHVPSDADRCPRCGGSHFLIIDEVIVVVPEDGVEGSSTGTGSGGS